MDRDEYNRWWQDNVSAKTVANREQGVSGLTTEVLIDTAHALGFTVALLPTRRPGTPTGTGWPT